MSSGDNVNSWSGPCSWRNAIAVEGDRRSDRSSADYCVTAEASRPIITVFHRPIYRNLVAFVGEVSEKSITILGRNVIVSVAIKGIADRVGSFIGYQSQAVE